MGYPALKINKDKGMIAASSITNFGSAGAYQLYGTEAILKSVCSLHLTVAVPSAGGSSYNDLIGVASPLTLASLDKKIDDGVARTGKFKGFRTWSSTVGDCLTGVGGDYLLTETRDSCFAEFIIAK